VTEGLVLRDVSKAFPGVQALADASFDVAPGEVHALVGENGAGKSTLLKILGGAHRPDAGAIALGGRAVVLESPRAARARGIAVIHQEPSLVPWLSVAHNLLLGREGEAGRWLLSRRRLHARARAALARLGVDLDPATPVAFLGVGEQQTVEIARALDQQAAFVLMDEPTAALSPRETAQLFAAIDALRQARVGILYISHRLEEIERIADRVTVLRDGRVIGTWRQRPEAETTRAGLIAAMVGRPLADHYPPRRPRPGDEMLRVAPPAGASGLALAVREGEVVGLAGLVGAGRTEWARRLVGAAPPRGERVWLRGRPVRIRSPRDARALGVGLVPEDRKAHGLVLERSLRDNVTLTVLDRLRGRCGLLDGRRQAALSGRFVERLRIRAPTDRVEVRTLSGGNQQKVVVAKWLARECQVLVLDEPTRGIDVGARLEMYHLINRLSEDGRAVVLISSDLPELLAMSDRLYVMRDGALVAELETPRATPEAVLAAAAG
jgi:ABC-type sugar transport system ATPase subunit